MITKEMYLLAKKVVESYDKQKLNTPVVVPSFFKERRLSLNLSMQDVTNKTDISKATISRIERGNDAFFDTVMTLDKFYCDNGA
jgi:DNA-binding XRE family transcriptional regulator